MSKKFTVLCNISLLSLVALTTACSDSKINKSATSTLTTVEASKLIDAGKNEEGADIYSQMGEVLMSRPEGVVYADMMFMKSLEAHSFNNKANLYSAILSPAMTLKGYVARVKPLAKDEDSKEALKQLEERIRETQVKEFIDFALITPKGKANMNKLDDVRKFIRNEYAAELKSSLAKLDKLSGDIELKINYTDKDKASLSSCRDANECFREISLVKKPSIIKVDAYDVKALRILMKTQRNALLIATSIGLNGAEEALELSNQGKITNDQEAVAAIKSLPGLLKIEGSKDDLREIFDHSEEVMNDLIDFSKISDKLCGNESRTSHAFDSICVSEVAADKISETLLFVAGPKALTLGHNEQGEEVTVEVDLKALINSNVSSLQELLPNKFDQNGRAKDLKDHTFLGIIPNGDLLSKIKTVVR